MTGRKITVALTLWCTACATANTQNAPIASKSGGEASTTTAATLREPTDCLLHLKKAHALVRADGDRGKTLASLRRLMTTIDDLRRQDLEDTAQLDDCASKAGETLRGAASNWTKASADGQSLDKVTLRQLGEVYKLYLEAFPSGSATYRFSFFRAQVLFNLGRWAEAGQAYDRIVKATIPKGDTDRRLEAALGAVVAWKKAFGLVSVKRSRGWPQQGKRLVSAIDTFLSVAPNSPERVSLRYSQARAYHRFGQSDAAVRIFGELATRHPRHELATNAARLLLDSLNAQKKHEQMRAWIKRLLGIKPLARGELLTQLRSLDRGLRSMAAEKLAQQSKFRLCGEAYERLMQDYPRHPRWADAAYNGGVCFENARLPSRALALRKRLVSRAPTSPLARKVLAHICARPEGKRVRWWRRRCK